MTFWASTPGAGRPHQPQRISADYVTPEPGRAPPHGGRRHPDMRSSVDHLRGGVTSEPLRIEAAFTTRARSACRQDPPCGRETGSPRPCRPRLGPRDPRADTLRFCPAAHTSAGRPPSARAGRRFLPKRGSFSEDTPQRTFAHSSALHGIPHDGMGAPKTMPAPSTHARTVFSHCSPRAVHLPSALQAAEFPGQEGRKRPVRSTMPLPQSGTLRFTPGACNVIAGDRQRRKCSAGLEEAVLGSSSPRKVTSQTISRVTSGSPLLFSSSQREIRVAGKK